MWLCQCDCGKEVIVRGASLTTGNTKSCGCLTTANAVTHGKSRTDEYKAWGTMLQRCTNPRATGFDRWGGRGITVCERWRRSFENFLVDLGPKPSPQHSIDRINNDGNYEPGNCRWATKQEQIWNSRVPRWITFRGITLPLAEWSRQVNILAATIRQRLNKGWSIERAFTTPPQKDKSHVKHS